MALSTIANKLSCTSPPGSFCKHLSTRNYTPRIRVKKAFLMIAENRQSLTTYNLDKNNNNNKILQEAFYSL